ncbi:hypothetical protein AURDEDRAFT_184621 [Auricularia subglabra TFB-10046 SS5]|nr:hypothetical protein AURDEDRAFT_184621 [Auricularia subglabra TFB-10046 SS5]
MTANSDHCVVEEGDESSFATCIDDEWAAIEALHGGDASSFDEHGSNRKQHLSAKQMSNLQQRTVAELFEEIARAKQLTPWGTSLDSPSSSEFPFPVRPDGAESETDLDVLNDDALAPFMGVGGPKRTTRNVLDPDVAEDADLLTEPREPVRVAFPQSQAPRTRQPLPPPAVGQQQPATGGTPSSARHCQPAPVAAVRPSRSPLERFSATVLPVRRQTSKPTLPRHQEVQEVSFLPHNAPDTATPRLPHKARSSALLRLPATLGRGLSRAGDKLRSRMSSLPSAQTPPVLSARPLEAEPFMEPSTSVLEIGASGSNATITGPKPSASSLAALPSVPVASTSAPPALDSPTLSRSKTFHERQSPSRRSVLADANAAYLLLRVPKMPPRAGAFPSTPSPFRSPATVFPPSPASSRPSSHRSDHRPESSSSLLSPASPICTRSVEDLRRLSDPDSPTIEFYRDRPLPPLPAARTAGSGKLRLGQVMAMRAHSQTAALRRVGSASTCRTVVPPPPRIVVHPYASAGVRSLGESEESSADESDADEVVDVLRRMRMTSPPRYAGAGLGLSLPSTPISARRRGVVDAL